MSNFDVIIKSSGLSLEYRFIFYFWRRRDPRGVRLDDKLRKLPSNSRRPVSPPSPTLNSSLAIPSTFFVAEQSQSFITCSFHFCGLSTLNFAPWARDFFFIFRFSVCFLRQTFNRTHFGHLINISPILNSNLMVLPLNFYCICYEKLIWICLIHVILYRHIFRFFCFLFFNPPKVIRFGLNCNVLISEDKFSSNEMFLGGGLSMLILFIFYPD